ncbi:hypothetical protein SteCoe_9267 [Stentor coeruleus]|uniref:LYR motif-containing protein Cup1-like N-terminal domain-containing protein n=1 Tax=Stentor coeruleus TaxID=5963 RepID=A0A1R2CIE3_9CILI|nr:hypothetical protein SteCoe_9267 [Stentor coeruleus]
MEGLLRRETRKPIVLNLLRELLKASKRQDDPIVSHYLSTTVLLAFKKEQKTTDFEQIKVFIDTQKSLLDSIKSAEEGNMESAKFIIDLSYGQVVFSARHDCFIQAKYLAKLPFGKKKISVFPIEGYHVVGPAPIPQEFKDHITLLLQKYPNKKQLYRHLLEGII